MLDNRAFLRYNNTRSGGQPPETMHLSDHGPVAQLVRAPACHAGGRRFEPDPGRFVESPAVHHSSLASKTAVMNARLSPLPHKHLLRKFLRGPR